MSATLTLQAACDVPYLSVSEVTKRIVRLTVANNDHSWSAARLPLNICLALDRSSSMAGSKLDTLKAAAISLIDHLGERDMIGVLAFDSKCEVIAPTTALFRDQKEQLQQRIAAIRTGNGTALLEAYLKSAGMVADHLLSHGVNEVLLVTDGGANLPAHPDPKEVAKHADELRKRGIQSSVYGIGADIKPFYLTPLSSYGGGSYTYLAGHGNAQMFQPRQNHLLHVVARDTTLRIAMPSGAKMRLLGDLPHSQDTLSIPIGNLSSGQTATLYVEILAATGQAGKSLPLNCTLSYLDNEDERIHQSLKATFVYADHATAKSAPRDYEVRQGAELVKMGYAIHKALYLNDRKQHAEAVSSLHQAISKIKYLSPAQVNELKTLAEKIERHALGKSEYLSQFHQAYRWQAMRKGE